MNKTFLILRHEFWQAVRRKSFLVLAFALPLAALLALEVYHVVSERGGGPAPPLAVTIGYVDRVGEFRRYTPEEGITLVPFATPDEATAALINGEIREYFIIPSDYLATGVVSRYTLQKELNVPPRIQSVMTDFLLSNLLQGQNPEVVERVEAPMKLVSTRLTSTGEVAPDQGGAEAFLLPYLFSILLAVSIFISSGYVLQGLVEEKENRVMEILLSSVSTRQLLVGKVAGLGAAGLVQAVVWLVSASFLVQLASTTLGGLFGALRVPPSLFVLGVVYFILGYLLFAVLMAGVGAISPTAREGQQLATLFTLIAVSPFWFMPFIMENPGHPISQALTIFPITAPITVMVRLGLAEIAPWELALSILLLIGSIIGVLLLAARVFRTFLLMYGKRPGLSEIIRSFRST